MTLRAVAAPLAADGSAPGSADGPPGIQTYTHKRAKALPLRSVNKWRFLDLLRPFSSPRTRACRKRRISPTVQVQVMGDGSRRVSGVLSCGSVWACPVCSQRICSHRADEIKSAILEWTKPHSDGTPSGVLSMASLTVRHGLGDHFKKLRKGVSGAWRRLLQGRKAATFRRLFHVKHHVRSLEVTHGENGYHPHLHVLIFGTEPPEPGALEWLRETWIAAVEKELGDEHAPDWNHGAVLSVGGGGSYLQKMGLEVAHHHTKSARRSSRTPWEIALDAIDGDEKSAALWRGFCRDIKGARQLTWSRGMRRFFGLGLRDSDADALAAVEAAEALESKRSGSVLADWDGFCWDVNARCDPFWVSKVATLEVWELRLLPGWLRAPEVVFDPLLEAGLPPAEPDESLSGS